MKLSKVHSKSCLFSLRQAQCRLPLELTQLEKCHIERSRDVDILVSTLNNFNCKYSVFNY